MICPAVLDPFQGASYRLVACMHQMILCPLISKTFGYVFSTQQNYTDEIKSNQYKMIEQEQKDDYNILDNLCNASTYTNRKELSDKMMSVNLNFGNGNKNENGCDIDNRLPDNLSISHLSDNLSNKKIQ